MWRTQANDSSQEVEDNCEAEMPETHGDLMSSTQASTLRNHENNNTATILLSFWKLPSEMRRESVTLLQGCCMAPRVILSLVFRKTQQSATSGKSLFRTEHYKIKIRRCCEKKTCPKKQTKQQHFQVILRTNEHLSGKSFAFKSSYRCLLQNLGGVSRAFGARHQDQRRRPPEAPLRHRPHLRHFPFRPHGGRQAQSRQRY